MPDSVLGRIIVDIGGGAIAGGGGGPGSSLSQADGADKEVKRQTGFLGTMREHLGTMTKNSANQPRWWTKTLKTMGIQVGVAGILKQSQIFTSTLGAFFQILGGFVDVILAPFMPMIVPAIRGFAKQIPAIRKKAEAFADWVENVGWPKLRDIFDTLFHPSKWGRVIKDGLELLKDTIWEALKRIWNATLGKVSIGPLWPGGPKLSFGGQAAEGKWPWEDDYKRGGATWNSKGANGGKKEPGGDGMGLGTKAAIILAVPPVVAFASKIFRAVLPKGPFGMLKPLYALLDNVAQIPLKVEVALAKNLAKGAGRVVRTVADNLRFRSRTLGGKPTVARPTALPDGIDDVKFRSRTTGGKPSGSRNPFRSQGMDAPVWQRTTAKGKGTTTRTPIDDWVPDRAPRGASAIDDFDYGGRVSRQVPRTIGPDVAGQKMTSGDDLATAQRAPKKIQRGFNQIKTALNKLKNMVTGKITGTTDSLLRTAGQQMNIMASVARTNPVLRPLVGFASRLFTKVLPGLGLMYMAAETAMDLKNIWNSDKDWINTGLGAAGAQVVGSLGTAAQLVTKPLSWLGKGLNNLPFGGGGGGDALQEMDNLTTAMKNIGRESGTFMGGKGGDFATRAITGAFGMATSFIPLVNLLGAGVYELGRYEAGLGTWGKGDRYESQELVTEFIHAFKNIKFDGSVGGLDVSIGGVPSQ